MVNVEKYIELDTYRYEGKYLLCGASLAQIMIALRNGVERVKDPKNEYQRVLYPWLEKTSNEIVEEFKKLLYYTDQVDEDARRYNLGGRLPRPVIAKYHNKVQLGLANFGPLINAAIQRTNYILNRNLPPRCNDDEAYRERFDNLRAQLPPFFKLLNDANTEFENIVGQSQTAANIDMDAVKQNRRARVVERNNKRGFVKHRVNRYRTDNQNNDVNNGNYGNYVNDETQTDNLEKNI